MGEWRESYPEPSDTVPDRGVDSERRLDRAEDRSGRQSPFDGARADLIGRSVGDLAVAGAMADEGTDWEPDSVVDVPHGLGGRRPRSNGWERPPDAPLARTETVTRLGAAALEGAGEGDPPAGGVTGADAADVRGDWSGDRIRELDVALLRRTATGEGRFSDRRMAWVPLELLEPTDEVGGEPFKGGQPTEEYAAQLGELYAQRDLHPTVDTVDPRHVGDYRVKLCEDPDTGLLGITNGRHRVEAAREAGLPAILAEVVVLRDAPDGQTRAESADGPGDLSSAPEGPWRPRRGSGWGTH